VKISLKSAAFAISALAFATLAQSAEYDTTIRLIGTSSDITHAGRPTLMSSVMPMSDNGAVSKVSKTTSKVYPHIGEHVEGYTAQASIIPGTAGNVQLALKVRQDYVAGSNRISNVCVDESGAARQVEHVVPAMGYREYVNTLVLPVGEVHDIEFDGQTIRVLVTPRRPAEPAVAGAHAASSPNYVIAGAEVPAFTPSQVWDDGKLTYVELAKPYKDDLPVLFQLDENGERSLVNYVWDEENSRFVVHRVLNHMVLALGDRRVHVKRS
jgi:hypothetical protein